MTKIVIFDVTNPESVKRKFNHKQEHPNDTFIMSSDKEGLKAALKGNVDNVINFDDNLDLRKLKGDKVVEGKGKKAPAKKKAAPKKAAAKPKAKAKKKAAPKKAAKKAPTKKKVGRPKKKK